MFDIILSCIFGLLIGHIYGLFFVAKQKRAFCAPATLLHTFIVPIASRLLMFSLLAYYLLITTQIHLILTVISFIISFWSTILQKKAISYGSF